MRKKQITFKGALLLASLALGFLAPHACTLDTLQAECFQCPCGSSEAYECEQGYCILKTTKASLTPLGLKDFLAKCSQLPSEPLPPPPTDGGPPSDRSNPPPPRDQPGDPCGGCPAGQSCDPATKQCKPDVQRCPDGQPRKPDGTCPGPCENVKCPAGQVCNETIGSCVEADCRNVKDLCSLPQCCHPATGSCTTDCRSCNDCPGGAKCNQNTGVCEGGSRPPPPRGCQAASSCVNGGAECCKQACSTGTLLSDTFAACECTDDKGCKSGKCATLILTNPPGIKRVCGCRNAADCGGGNCKDFFGTKVCVQ